MIGVSSAALEASAVAADLCWRASSGVPAIRMSAKETAGETRPTGASGRGPGHTGKTADANATAAEARAIGIVSRTIRRTPVRLTAAKKAMMPQAMAGVGTRGRHHSWIAPPDSRANTPQVGIHPHQ